MELQRKTRAMLQFVPAIPHGTLVVVGCGDGEEAGVLAAQRCRHVLGIDVSTATFANRHGAAQLSCMDARALAIRDRSVQFVYSFHALEHILPPEAALREIRRVLAPGGRYLIGTPNRTRAVGYINAPATIAERIRWNVADWKMRLRGRFRNEDGAHAGFTESELILLCARHVGPARPITGSYYRALYPGHVGKVNLLERAKLGRFFYPSVYVTGEIEF